MQFAWQIADGMNYLSSIKVREESFMYLYKSNLNAKAYIQIEVKDKRTYERTIPVNPAEDCQYSTENVCFV